MAVITKSVTKAANQDAVIDLGVGKKVYGVAFKYGFDVFIRQNGKESRLIDGSVAQYYFPYPLEFAASASIVFKGTAGGTPLIITDE